MADDIALVRLLGEVAPGHDLAGEVRVSRVDAGVEHGHLHALAGVAAGPGVGRPDLLDALVQRHLPEPVEPDLAARPEQPGPAGGSGQAPPEPRRLRAFLLYGVAADRGQRGRPGAAEQGGRWLRPGDDERQRAAAVVVPVVEQRRHVEQPLVEAPGPEQRERVAGDHA
ncbi:hypothetical protein ABZ912_44100 [Nonomuraea angiospora]|uniref:hypothetical protein n=1 Tax=Nonomuraea angiospora TaxID=46172 RepID=UPI0033DDAC90